MARIMAKEAQKRDQELTKMRKMAEKGTLDEERRLVSVLEEEEDASAKPQSYAQKGSGLFKKRKGKANKKVSTLKEGDVQ